LIGQATECFQNYDYAAAKGATESFFWRVLADNYLEMCKLPLYEEESEGARYALHTVLLTVLKLFAPFLPHVTEEIYQGLFVTDEGDGSIHKAPWPVADETLVDEPAEAAGDVIVDIATAVRRHKTEHQLFMGAEFECLWVATQDLALREALRGAQSNIRSVTRAKSVKVHERLDPESGRKIIADTETIAVAITG
jgi:valyl-tRNA synthetase